MEAPPRYRPPSRPDAFTLALVRSLMARVRVPEGVPPSRRVTERASTGSCIAGFPGVRSERSASNIKERELPAGDLLGVYLVP